MKQNGFAEQSQIATTTLPCWITVIIPTSNRADVLKMSLDALNRQSMPADRFEVIVCDDGSTDATSTMVPNYPSRFHLKYLLQEKRGAGAARNLGLRQARGEFILMLNDDAIAAPTLLESYWNVYQKHSGENLAILGSFPFSKETEENPFFRILKNSHVLFQYDRMEAGRLYDWRYFWTCNIGLPFSLLEEVGFFDENFPDPAGSRTSYYGGEDIDLGIRLWKKQCQILYEPACSAVHYHSIGLHQFCKREIAVGRHLVLLALKHPELTEELTGFRDFGRARTKLTSWLARNQMGLQDAWKTFSQIESGQENSENVRPGKMTKMLSTLNGFWLRHGMLQGLARTEDYPDSDDSNSLRITFVVPGLKLSGGIRMILEYCNRLHARGHRITLVTMTPETPDWFSLNPEVRIIESGWSPGRLTHDLPEADLVFASHWSTAYPVACLPPSRGVPCYFLQSYESRTLSKPEAADPTLLLPLHGVAISHWLAEEIRKDFQMDVTVVPNAIDTKVFYPDETVRTRYSQSEFRVGMIFHPEPRKGSAEGWEAIRTASIQIPGLRLVALGTPTIVEEIAKIEIHQDLVGDELREYYNSLDVFLSTSHEEGFGLPGLEALACRVPLVTTDSGGPGEYAMHEETALVCPVRNPTAVSEAIIRIFRDHELRETIRRNGFRKAKEFEFDSSVLRMEAFCKQAWKEGTTFARKTQRHEIGAGKSAVQGGTPRFWSRILWRVRDEAHRRGWIRRLRNLRLR